MDNNEALHKAIRKNDMEMFLGVLHQPGINLNVRDHYKDETPLLRSIQNRNSAMAKHLIKAGCDVNLTDPRKRSPLDHAITVMHYVYYEKRNKLELVSMLLYYGADANVTNWRGEPPITRALKYCNKDVPEFLLNYYDDFFWKTGGGDTTLRYATEMESPLVIDLVERGADVNCLDSTYGQCLLYYTQHNCNAATFKFIWSRISHETLLNVDVYPILLHYLKYHSCTSNSEYFECLYLMLESPIAYLLIQDGINWNYNYRSYTFVHDVLYMFDKRNVLPNDRLSLIYLFLGFGVEIKYEDLQCAYERYGLNEEFKALLYAGNLNYYDFTEQIRHCKQLKEGYYTKGFSSLSLEKKQHVISQISVPSYYSEYKQILEALNKVPEFPSLLELSRNGAQKFVHENFEVTKLYQFYDAVNCLKLPQVMKDVILLEKPIYANFLVSHKN